MENVFYTVFSPRPVATCVPLTVLVPVLPLPIPPPSSVPSNPRAP
jgi:hypothetical protein